MIRPPGPVPLICETSRFLSAMIRRTDGAKIGLAATGISSNGCKAHVFLNVVADLDTPKIFLEAGILDCHLDSVPVTALADRPLDSLIWSGPAGFSAIGPEIFTSLPGSYTCIL